MTVSDHRRPACGLPRRHINCGMCRGLWRDSDVSADERSRAPAGTVRRFRVRFLCAVYTRPGAPWCTHAPLCAPPRGSMVFRTSDVAAGRGGLRRVTAVAELDPHRLSTACGGGAMRWLVGWRQCRRGFRSRCPAPDAPARRRATPVGRPRSAVGGGRLAPRRGAGGVRRPRLPRQRPRGERRFVRSVRRVRLRFRVRLLRRRPGVRPVVRPARVRPTPLRTRHVERGRVAPGRIAGRGGPAGRARPVRGQRRGAAARPGGGPRRRAAPCDRLARQLHRGPPTRPPHHRAGRPRRAPGRSSTPAGPAAPPTPPPRCRSPT